MEPNKYAQESYQHGIVEGKYEFSLETAGGGDYYRAWFQEDRWYYGSGHCRFTVEQFDQDNPDYGVVAGLINARIYHFDYIRATPESDSCWMVRCYWPGADYQPVLQWEKLVQGTAEQIMDELIARTRDKFEEVIAEQSWPVFGF